MRFKNQFIIGTDYETFRKGNQYCVTSGIENLRRVSKAEIHNLVKKRNWERLSLALLSTVENMSSGEVSLGGIKVCEMNKSYSNNQPK